jgi:hypothetical protein
MRSATAQTELNIFRPPNLPRRIVRVYPLQGWPLELIFKFRNLSNEDGKYDDIVTPLLYTIETQGPSLAVESSIRTPNRSGHARRPPRPPRPPGRVTVRLPV